MFFSGTALNHLCLGMGGSNYFTPCLSVGTLLGNSFKPCLPVGTLLVVGELFYTLSFCGSTLGELFYTLLVCNNGFGELFKILLVCGNALNILLIILHPLSLWECFWGWGITFLPCLSLKTFFGFGNYFYAV